MKTSYTPTGVGPYRSNWLMNLMLENDDPRIRYYFYRQADGTPGANDVGGNPVPPMKKQFPVHYLHLLHTMPDLFTVVSITAIGAVAMVTMKVDHRTVS